MSPTEFLHRVKSYLVALLLLVSLIVTFPQSAANAASSKLNASQCKQAISSFKGLYDPAGGLQVSGWKWDPVTGSAIGEVKPPISKLVSSRKTWKSLETSLANGSTKSGFQLLIEEAYMVVTTGRANGNEGRVSLFWTSAIVEITKSCLPPESNEFCRTINSSLTSISNLQRGISISKSGVLNTKRIWANEVKRWPPQSNSRAWMTRLLTYLDEAISETKAKRSTMAALGLFYDDWSNLDLNNDVIDYWPCRDRVADALGLPS
jgi:hypothetical protein